MDGRQSHIHCQGDGSPTVVLEAGFDHGGSSTWSTVQSDLSEISRVCSYDRGGVLWSERRTEPRDAHHIADELHALLQAAGEAPPYLMVGHSLGGPLIRVFDQRFADEVAGFVFVDSSHPEQRGRFPAEVRQQPRPSISRLELVLARIGVRRLLGGSLPEDARSAHALRSLPGMAAEMAAIPRIFEQSATTGPLGDRPVVVLTAGVGPSNPTLGDDVNERLGATWVELQTELAELSTNSDRRTVDGSGHYIQADAPTAVIDAVRDVVSAVRSNGRIRAAEDGNR